MTDRQLRGTLARIADDVTVVDLGPRVRARSRVLRRRRRVAAVAAPVAGVLVAAALLASPSEPDAAPPAGPDQAPTVELSQSSRGPLGSAAVLGLVDSDSGAAWVVTRGGRAATVSGPAVALPGAPPVLSADGSVLSFGGAGTVTALSTIDGEVTEVPAPDGLNHLVSVSPDGRTAAYAADNQVDAVELTLVPLDGSPHTTLQVTTTGAAGELVPVVWSDDGSAVLVLEGLGATRVDLGATPRPTRGVYVKEDLVLAHGWAASPDLDRFAMGATRTLAGGQRQWHVLDSESGQTVEVISRPTIDRLIGWTGDDRLVWWLPTGDGYTVLSTDTAGESPRRELRVVTELPNLVATWTEENG